MPAKRIRLPRRPLVALLCAALVAAPFPAAASQVITCSSSGYRYEYCRVDTDNDVKLERQRSTTECRQGYSWGYDRRGVWVDHGCAADFRVGSRSQGSSGSGDKALAVGAALAGVAIIAALASQGSKSQEQSSDAPSWAVGTFTGYDSRIGGDVELTILPGGKVTGWANRSSFEGRFDGSRLTTERQAFRVERSGNGFVAIDERDAAHRVVYRRSGGGY